MKKFLVAAVMAALVGATLTHRAQADTASATCEVRKDGVAAGEEAARKNAGGGGGDGGDNGKHFINELDNGGFEVVWKGQNCFISFNASGRSTSVSPGCNDKQIRRSDEIARDRTR
jgi:hypothetical protein